MVIAIQGGIVPPERWVGFIPKRYRVKQIDYNGFTCRLLAPAFGMVRVIPLGLAPIALVLWMVLLLTIRLFVTTVKAKVKKKQHNPQNKSLFKTPASHITNHSFNGYTTANRRLLHDELVNNDYSNKFEHFCQRLAWWQPFCGMCLGMLT